MPCDTGLCITSCALKTRGLAGRFPSVRLAPRTDRCARFLQQVAETPGYTPVNCPVWVGVDLNIRRELLEKFGYTRYIQADVQSSDGWLDQDYDAVVLLHVLEHLRNPEEVVARIAGRMKPGSVVMGGFPSIPNWCVSTRQRQIKNNPRFTHGHVSVFSPARVRRMARESGLRVEFLSGAYFLRSGGLFLEDHRWWLPRFQPGFRGFDSQLARGDLLGAEQTGGTVNGMNVVSLVGWVEWSRNPP